MRTSLVAACGLLSIAAMAQPASPADSPGIPPEGQGATTDGALGPAGGAILRPGDSRGTPSVPPQRMEDDRLPQTPGADERVREGSGAGPQTQPLPGGGLSQPVPGTPSPLACPPGVAASGCPPGAGTVR